MYYDIHPIKSTTTLTSAFSTTNGSAEVTITFSGAHNISAQDIILLDSFSAITNSDFAAADFNDKKFMVTSVPTSTTLTITMPSNESGSGATTSGGIRVQHYYPVGPAVQAQGPDSFDAMVIVIVVEDGTVVTINFLSLKSAAAKSELVIAEKLSNKIMSCSDIP